MTRQEFIKQLPGLITGYQPAPESLQRIKNVSLLIIIGPSGVGKSSTISRLGLHFVPTDVTRKPRPGEKEGVDFYFLTDYDQVVTDIKSGSFLQVALGASGDLYATKPSSYPERGDAVMPVMADVVPHFRKLGFAKTVSAFITPPSYHEWMRRIESHPVSPEELEKRLAEARRSLDFALNDDQTHFILNDNLEEAAMQIKQLLQGQIATNQEALARSAAETIRSSIN